LKDSIAAYANMEVFHVHQAPGDGLEVKPLRRRTMF
jgi:hypothetical protein